MTNILSLYSHYLDSSSCANSFKVMMVILLIRTTLQTCSTSTFPLFLAHITNVIILIIIMDTVSICALRLTFCDVKLQDTYNFYFDISKATGANGISPTMQQVKSLIALLKYLMIVENLLVSQVSGNWGI